MQNEDRERERLMLNDDSTRHQNLRMKEVPEKYGLWDNVYDKRVIRALDCNATWQPNRKEQERRKRQKAKREREIRRRAEDRMRQQGGHDDGGDSDDEEDVEERGGAAGGDEDGSGGAAGGGGGGDDDGDEDAAAFADARNKWFETGAELTEDDMSFIGAHTKFEPYAVRKHFGNFRRECPNGRLSKGHLHRLFKRIFPGGDSEVFCNHIFRIFDSDGNGFLDFKEFLMALDVTSCRSEREKLEWAFRLYDVDDSGSINLREITTIMETLDQVSKKKMSAMIYYFFFLPVARISQLRIFHTVRVQFSKEPHFYSRKFGKSKVVCSFFSPIHPAPLFPTTTIWPPRPPRSLSLSLSALPHQLVLSFNRHKVVYGQPRRRRRRRRCPRWRPQWRPL